MEYPASITAAELVATMDWSKTPIGPREEWPPQLVTAVELCLESTFPMALYLGPGRNLIYGDAWRPTLGTKHPQAMGQPGQKVWEEIWNVVGILMDEAYSSGKGVLCHDTRLMMERHGYVEETYYSFSFSPLRGPDNSVIGLVNVCFETSQRVMSERRLNTLSELAIRTPSASCLVDACKVTAQTLKGNKDIPFAFIYMASEDNKTATLVASTFDQDLQREENDKEYAPDNASKEQPEDFPSALLTLPTTVSLTAFDEEEQEESSNLPQTNSRAGVSPRRALPTMNSSKYHHAALGKDWPVAQVFATGATMLVSLPEGQGRVMLVPVTTSYEEQGHTSAVMVARVNPFLPFDTYYEEFYNLVGGHLSTALNNAKAREEERKRAEKLAELDKAKTDFFCNISHEFRTPLTLIVAPLADLLQSENLLPDHRQQLETVFRNGQRLLKLVNTLLDFSRIEVGRVQARYRPIDLGTFTQELVSEFESSAERLGLQLITRCVKGTKSANEEEIYVDKDMWEKIVLNLVSNALKFTWKGSITVSVERVNGGIEMQVKDTGVGISEKDLQKLFQRFYRIQNDKARSHEGSGIGLALAQELVKLHGGTIRVESQEGKGTTFTVFIPSGYKHLPRDKVVMPLSDDVADCGQRDSVSQNKIAGCYTTDQYASEILNWDTNSSAQSLLERPVGKGKILDEKNEEEAEEEEDERERQEEEEEFEQEKMEEIASEMLSSKPRVLIADDNADMRNYVSRLLSPHFRVTTVTNGAEALEMIRRVPPPDLVISDVMMPIKDGFSLLHDVRANKKTHSIPFILLSARAGPDASAEGLDSGADDYLAKPFSATELVAKARATVKLSRLRKQMNLREKQLVKRKHLVMRIGEKIRCGKISMQEVLDSTVAEVRAVLKADAVRIYRFEEVARKRSITSTNHGTTEEASGTDSDGEVKGTQRHGDYDTGDPERKNMPQQDSSPPRLRRQKLQPNKAQNSIRRRSLSADSGERRIKKNGKDLEVPDQTLAAKEYEDRYVGTEEAVVEEEEGDRDARYPCPTQQVCTIPAESVDSHRLPEKRYLGLKFAMNNCESEAGLWDVNFSTTDIWQDSKQTERLVAMLPNELQAENSISAIIPMRDKVWGLLQCVRWAPLSSSSSRLDIQEMKGDNSWSKVDKALLLQIALQVGLGLNQARLMEERMQQQTQLEAAQAANKAKSMIMANTSHEIRTPLNAIIGMMEMLRDTPLNAEQKEMVQTLQHSSELLLEIVNDILDFSRMEMDKVLFHCSEFEVGSLVERTMDMFAEQAGMRQIELVNMSDLVTSNSGLWVRSDPFRLQQVLVNLINNAIKFTERGGEVMVKVRYSIVEQSPIASSSFPRSSAIEPGAETATGEASHENESDNFGDNPKEVILHVEIIDTGIGISEEGVQKIFQSFSQVNASTTREHGGTGLGLAISKRLVEMAGGEIGVTTKPGKGSTFWFTWRCQLLPSPSSSSTQGHRFTLKQLQTSYSTDGCLLHPYDQRVLVIEAKQHSLDSILLQLCDIVECEGSTSMEQGLRLFYRGLKQGRPFTIIVLDIASPNLESAINTGRALHRHQSWLRVVLLSGSSQIARGLARQGLAMLGSHLSSGYVTKPIKKSELTKCIRAAIAKSLSSWHSLSGCKDREKGYQQQLHPSKEEEEEEEEQQEETERNTAAGHPPLVQKSETKNEEKDVTQTTTDKTNHILVVEDNRVNIKVVLAQLRKLGLPATVATNGKEAIDIINAAPTGHFALVLMDLAMPIMDGYEATKQLREMSQRAEMDVRRRRYLSNLPIVALSASGMDRDQQRCEAAGMTAFLSKPLKLAQLRQTLQRWLPIPLSE